MKKKETEKAKKPGKAKTAKLTVKLDGTETGSGKKQGKPTAIGALESEFADSAVKTGRLYAFLHGPDGRKLPKGTLKLLFAQYYALAAYTTVLEIRLDRTREKGRK